MATVLPKVILLKGEKCVQRELLAGGTIYPGMTVEFNAGAVRAQSVDAGICLLMFADNPEFVGADIATAIATGDTVRFWTACPGSEVYAWLSTGNSVAKGDALVHDVNGSFRKAVTAGSTADDNAAICAFAMETLNNTTGAKARLRIVVK